MNKLYKKVTNFYSHAYFPFFILLCVFLFQSLFIHVGWSDDSWFYDAIKNAQATNVFTFLIHHHNTWTSRVIIEFFLLFFVRHRNLWRICNAIVNVIGTISLSYLTGCLKCKKLNLFVCMLVLLIPQYIYCNTGWVATTLNYSWPLFIGLFSLVFVKKLVFKNKLSWYEYILLIFSSLFASNHEQMCVSLFLIYSAFFVYDFCENRKVKVQLLIPFVLNICMLVYELTCPGNKERYAFSVTSSFKDFDIVPLYRKLELGFSSTLHEVFIKPNLIFFAFTLLIFLCVVSKHKKLLSYFVSCVPLFTFFAFNFLVNIFPRELEGVDKLKNSMTKYGSGITLHNPRSAVLDFLFIVLIVAIIYSLFLCFENRFRFFVSVGVLLVGFISRMVQSFSPCIWESGERTFLFFYAAIIMVSVLIYKEINSKRVKEFTYIAFGLISFVLCFSILFTGQY